MPPKKAKTGTGHVKCDPIPEGTIYKGTNKREVIVGKEFAQGGFGRICDAKLVGKSEKLIIKLEPSGNGPLFTEMHVFQRIFRAEMIEAYKKKHKLSHLGLPYLVESGMQEEIRFLVMPKYSFCLDHIVKESRSPLKLENVVDILQCVCNALKYMHENDYVHADIKAANIMMNKKNGFNEVYLIDFGLARKVGTVVEKEDKKKAHDGTALFTSTDAHRGCGFTFRGDVEILGHNALFWLTKTLPWKNLFDEEATLKIKAEQLNEVRAAKESLLSNLSTNLKKHISDSSAAAVVQMLYKASKIDINTKPDFDAVLKTLSTANKGKKKASTESDSEEYPPPQPARRGRKPVIREDDEEDEDIPAAHIPSSSSRTTRKKKSESDVEELDPPVRRKAKMTAAKKHEEGPTPASARPRRGRGGDSDSEILQSSAKPSRTRQTSATEIIPGLATRNAGKAAMPSHQEEVEESDEEDDEEYEPSPPPKPTHRYATTPKIPPRSLIETPKQSAKSNVNYCEASPDVKPSPRKYPYVDSSPSRPIKKPNSNYECKALTDSQSNKILTPQPHQMLSSKLSSSASRTRSIDHNLFSPRAPSSSNYQNYYKHNEPKPKVPLVKRRSRSFENAPPVSPEFRIKAIPQPQGNGGIASKTQRKYI